MKIDQTILDKAIEKWGWNSQLAMFKNELILK